MTDRNKHLPRVTCERTEQDPAMDRRDFIRGAVVTGAGLATASFAETLSAQEQSAQPQVSINRLTRMLGPLEVSPLGLGCMSMTSGSYNPPRSKAEMTPVIRGAFERGITFFDTAEVYGPFTNEEIVGQALRPIRDQVVIASKFGFAFSNGERAGRNSKPESIKRAVEGMLRRLQTDRIDLLYLHRVDPEVPVEEVAQTVAGLVQEGKVLHFGLSEVAPATLRRAHAVHPVAALQSEYSLVERAPENQILATCEELGVGFVPWGGVCRGFLADKFNEYSRFSEESRHASVPYFTPEAIHANMDLLGLVRDWAVEKNATPAQIALAWLLAEKPFIVPIPGSTKLHHIEENLGALRISLSSSELAEIRTAFSQIDLIGVRPPGAALVDQ